MGASAIALGISPRMPAAGRLALGPQRRHRARARRRLDADARVDDHRPVGPAISGLQSSSTISGCASTIALTRSSTSSIAAQVAAGRAAVAVEQRERAQRAEHLARVEVGQRRDPHRDVADQLGGRPAGAAREHRAEAVVVDDADDQLDARPGPSAARPGRRAGSPARRDRGSISRRRGSHRLGACRAPSRTPPASLLCTSPGALALSATGTPELGRRGDRLRRRRRRRGSSISGRP